MRRGLAVAAFAAMGAACGGDAGDSLTVASWGGSYTRACRLAYYEPFSADTDIVIREALYNGGLAEVRAQVDVGRVHWDIVSMEMADAVRGCDEGLLEPLDPALWAPGADGAPPEEDFFPGTLTECGVGAEFYATVIAYNRENIPDPRPATIQDFFDLEAFPGRRGMRRKPMGNMEFALMADGVSPQDVYAVLDTPDGIERAFRKLDTIKDRIVWWEAGAQPPQLLADGEVTMTTAYNGRIFNAQVLGEPALRDHLGRASFWTSGSWWLWRGRRIWTRQWSSWPSRPRPGPWPRSAVTSPTAPPATRACRWWGPTSRSAWTCSRTCPPIRRTSRGRCATTGSGG